MRDDAMNREGMEQWLRDAVGELPSIPGALRPLLDALWQALEAERARAEQAEATLAFYKASADAMPNPIFIKDDQLRFAFFNRAYREFFDLAKGEYLGLRVGDLPYLSEEDRERYHAEDSEMLATLSTIQYETDFDVSHPGGKFLYWSRGFAVPETGQRGVIGEIVDISREKEIQQELERSLQALRVLMKNVEDSSKIDPNTKLYNRGVLDNEVPYLFEKAAELGQSVCMLLMDIDYFKSVNDTFGHLYGDEVLRRLAQILLHSFRQQDLTVRYGGDEFMVFLPNADLRQAVNSAERLCQAVRTTLDLPDGRYATLSVGAAQWKQGDNLTSFIARADEALYMAKKAGRDGVQAIE